MLSEGKHIQKATYYIIPFIGVYNKEIQRHKVYYWMSGAGGGGSRKVGNDY